MQGSRKKSREQKAYYHVMQFVHTKLVVPFSALLRHLQESFGHVAYVVTEVLVLQLVLIGGVVLTLAEDPIDDLLNPEIEISLEEVEEPLIEMVAEIEAEIEAENSEEGIFAVQSFSAEPSISASVNLFSGCLETNASIPPVNLGGRDITLTDSNGGERLLSSTLGGKFVMITLAGSGCATCGSFAQTYKEDTDFQSRTFNASCTFVAVTPPDELNGRLDEVGVSGHIGQRSFGSVSFSGIIDRQTAGVSRPVHLIMDRNGNVVKSFTGDTLPADFEDYCVPCPFGGVGTGSCTDGIRNGTESDIDCGGECPVCTDGSQCFDSFDCDPASYCDVSSNSFSPEGNVFTTQSNSSAAETVTVVDDITPATQTIQQSAGYDNQQDVEYVEDRYIVKFKTDADTPRRLLPDFDESEQSASEYLGSLQRMYNTPRGAQYDMDQQLAVHKLMIKNIVRNDVENVEKLFASSYSDILANTYELEVGAQANENQLVQELEADPNVEYVEQIPIYTIDVSDPYATPSNMRYISKVEADRARTAGAQGSSSVVIAVIDNAFQVTHPDLQANMLPGYDASNGDSNPTPPSSRGNGMPGAHGTHTAGSAAAVTNNALGVAAISHNVKILPIKATADNHPPDSVAYSLEAIQYAAGRSDVNIISMSFGGGGSSQTIQNIISAHPEKLFIAAAGNASTSTPSYPAAYNGVLAVAASTESDVKAGFSNYGSWIDISSPGVSILSTMNGSSYGGAQGTSMATPVAASLAGLIWSAGAGSADETEQILLESADAMPASQAFCNGRMGAGRINACKAMNELGISCTSTYGPNGGPSSCGSTPTPSCGDGTCNGTETCNTCSQDCGSCGGGTTAGSTTAGGTTAGSTTAGSTTNGNTTAGGPVCGDTVCEDPETCSSCEYDCGACGTTAGSTTAGSTTAGSTTAGSTTAGSTTAGSTTAGSTTAGSTTAGSTTAGGTTAGAPVCGDSACNGNESCSTCESDCGACQIEFPLPACGDSICNGNESCSDCSIDCGMCNPPQGGGICTPRPSTTCNNNNACETDRGETEQNCGDCQTSGTGCNNNGICEAEREEANGLCPQDCFGRPDEGSGSTTEGGTTAGSTTAGSTTDGSTTDGRSTEGNTTDGSSTAGSTTAGSTTAGSTTAGSTTAGSTTAGSTTAGTTTAGSTAGSTTAGSSTAGSSTAGSTTAGSNGGGTSYGGGQNITQAYPLMRSSLTSSKVNMQAGDTAIWTLSFVYETYQPYYPTSQLHFLVTLPVGLSYTANSDDPSFTGGYDGISTVGSQLTIKVDTSDMTYTASTSAGNTVRKYQGSVVFGVSANTKVTLSSTQYPVNMGCFGMSPTDRTYVGTKTCTTSTSATDMILSSFGSGGTGTGQCTVAGTEGAACSDGKDNDCDGKFDCADTECSSNPICNGLSSSALCGNSTIERIYGEQCDNGEKNGTGEPVGEGRIVCSSSCAITQGVNLCGNSFINGDEECDDGNTVNGDGCNRGCGTEAGWRCDEQEPSECTDRLCRSHGEFYTSTDPYGLCCPGLSSQIIGSGTAKVMACYNSSIGAPECRIDDEEGKIGRQIKTSSNQRSFVKEEVCEGAGVLIGTGSGIYYRRLWSFLNETELSCQYTDADYSKVDFIDIKDSRQRTAILALKDACIVKGRGNSGTLFFPDGNMSRAEFIKLFMKTIYLGTDKDFGDESSIKIIRTPYADVPIGYWGSSYIAEAEKLGILGSLENNSMRRLIYPNKSITKQEVIAILQKRNEGYPMARSLMESLLGKGNLPTRAAIGDVITRKYIDRFLPYYYQQGNNRQYFEGLLKQLQGKSKKSQRDVINEEIKKLDSADADKFEKEFNFYPFRISMYLKGVLIK